jgi:sulfate adenylyltransferase
MTGSKMSLPAPTLPDGDLMADPSRAAWLRHASREWPSWDLLPRQLCDLELLLNGGFAPLAGFMAQSDYTSVCAAMRLASGTPWPVPITLDVPADLAARLAPGSLLALRDAEGVMLAALHVEDWWVADVAEEARLLGDAAEASGVRPSVRHPIYVGGRLEGVQLPRHYDYRELRRTPAETRAEMLARGWMSASAYQPDWVMHRREVEATRRAAVACGASPVVIQALARGGAPADPRHHTWIRCLKAIQRAYPGDTALVTIVPFARHDSGPREPLLRAIVARNYGCSHLLVDARSDEGSTLTDAGVGAGSHGVGITTVPVPPLAYAPALGCYTTAADAGPDQPRELDAETMRNRIESGTPLPDWFTFPPVADELTALHRRREHQGVTVFFTGLSGSGKSTIANILLVNLLAMGGRRVTLLDGDLVRHHLSSELGFSKAHRDLNVRRIGYVASEITKSGGIAICAPIAPYDAPRRDVRHMVTPLGGFVLVHIATPLETCEQRDRKGLYAKARAGLLPQFTGVSDPYEVPADAEVTIDTRVLSATEAAETILRYLREHRYLPPPAPDDARARA